MGLKEMSVPFAPSKYSYFFFFFLPPDDRRRRWLASAKSQHGFSFHKSQPLIMTHATHARRLLDTGATGKALQQFQSTVLSILRSQKCQHTHTHILRRATSSIALKMEGNETAAAPVCVLKAYEIVVVVHHNHGIPSFMINPCSITIEMMKRERPRSFLSSSSSSLIISFHQIPNYMPYTSIHPHTHTCATSADV